MSVESVNAVRRRFWIAWLASCAVLLLLGALVLAGFFYLHKGPLAARGGWYFFQRTEIPVPQYFQGDPRWANDLLGPTEGTLGEEGCAVASAAMVLQSYGINTDPGALNKFLTAHAGYTPEGWLYWEKAAEIAPTQVRHVYEDAASYFLIDANLRRGNPVIVRLRYPNGVTHFMVLCGKEGFDYLVRDPGANGAKGVYPLKEFGSGIEALRYYEKLP